MITEQLIIEAYTFLRKNNQSIPDEVLDFMKDVSIKKLRNIQKEEEEHEKAEKRKECIKKYNIDNPDADFKCPIDNPEIMENTEDNYFDDEEHCGKCPCSGISKSQPNYCSSGVGYFSK